MLQNVLRSDSSIPSQSGASVLADKSTACFWLWNESTISVLSFIPWHSTFPSYHSVCAIPVITLGLVSLSWWSCWDTEASGAVVTTLTPARASQVRNTTGQYRFLARYRSEMLQSVLRSDSSMTSRSGASVLGDKKTMCFLVRNESITLFISFFTAFQIA